MGVRRLYGDALLVLAFSVAMFLDEGARASICRPRAWSELANQCVQAIKAGAVRNIELLRWQLRIRDVKVRSFGFFQGKTLDATITVLA